MIYRKPLFLVAGAALLTTLPAAGLRAQAPAPAAAPAMAPMSFDAKLGSRTMDGATYSVDATQPAGSGAKSQRVRFTSVAPTGSGTTTRYFIINTGKYKTVAQLNAYLLDVFRKFLSGAPTNAEVGKVGDIKYGGEIRFVVETPSQSLRYESLTEGAAPSTMMLSHAEVEAYAAILAGK